MPVRRAWAISTTAVLMLTLASSAQAATYVPPTPQDLSSMTWTQAFDALVTKMSREYAFTQWKDIRWRELAREYRPRIEAAQARDDATAYLLALREFTHETHDGHVSIRSETGESELKVRRELAGGGFGLIVNRVQDGDVVATWVQRGGPAWTAGIRRGAVIGAWNGTPIASALRRTSTALAPNQPTKARVGIERLRFLVRAPIGAQRTVRFTNPQATARTVKLRAIDDDERTLRMTDASSVLARGIPKDMVTSRMLPGNVGYVRVKAEIDLPPGFPGDHTPTLEQFRTAIRGFQNAKVSGLVVDIRANAGGSDQMVADMMASFYTKPSFYEYQNYIVPETGRFQIWKGDDKTGEYRDRGKGIWITPGDRPYTGPIAVLIDNGCISSCEGVAMGLSRLPNATLIGFYGTNGSFGMVGDGVLMPGGQQIGWPFGQSLDRHKKVQIDSRNLVGGVAPDLRVPITLTTMGRTLRGHDVLLRIAVREVNKRAR
jgi:carboxyl-terminal processing protease